MQTAAKIDDTVQKKEVKKGKPYSVINVEKIDTPDGLEGDNWYRYLIDYGHSVIEGKKAGILKVVREHAEAVVEDLNSRSFVLGNTVSYASRNKKK
jgi:hypothetical protein